MEDNRIVDLFFERSEMAITELSAKYGPICERVSFNILGNHEDTEECVNDAYLGVWNAIPPARPNPLLAFLLKLVRNISINRYQYIHAQKRAGNYQECLDEFDWCVSSDETPEDIYIASQLPLYIDEFLDTLSRTNRLIFVRRYWYMDSFTEIASVTGLREGTVRTRLSRQREQLRKFLLCKGVNL